MSVLKAKAIRIKDLPTDIPDKDLYIVNIYCCNCRPQFEFSVKIPKGLAVKGCFATCPNCEVLGCVNNLHQLWPVEEDKTASANIRVGESL